jgi:transcriptional regulator with XRE-family HTH domain
MRALRRPAPASDDTTPERDLSYSIAQSVYELRIQEGISQEELAARVGTKQPRISVVESARGLPSVPLLLRIAKAFGRRLVIRFEKTGEEE